MLQFCVLNKLLILIMNADFYKTRVAKSILPVFFFISGFFSLGSPVVSSYEVFDSSFLIPVMLLVAGGYLFLKDSVSSIINLGCTVNVLFGILFFIDLFKVKYSPLAGAALIISLGFSVFLTTILLCCIHRTKQPFEREADEAVNKMILRNIWMIVLSFSALILLIFCFAYAGGALLKDDFLIIAGAGIIVGSIMAVTLLPLLSSLWLGHVNEERMQDDLELSFSEKMLMDFNLTIEKTAVFMLWIVSPLISRKPAFIITAGVFSGFLGLIFYSPFIFQGNSMQGIVLIIFYLAAVMRYQSYVLAFIPVLSISFNYFAVVVICNFFFSDSAVLAQFCISAAMIVTVITSYLHLDTALGYIKGNLNLHDAVLNASAETLYLVCAAITALLFLILPNLYLTDIIVMCWSDFLLAGFVIVFPAVILLFPAPAFLAALISIHNECTKPRKKRIKSIYL